MRTVDKAIIEKIIKICGADAVTQAEDQLAQYAKDWTYQPHTNAALVVFPRTTEQVSQVVKVCHESEVAIVPSGGRTGLAGGAVALNGEVVLSLDKMNKILSVDPIGLTAEVEAGVTTQALQEEAKEKGVFFALDLAAKGSSQIGGNIATNAGGLKLIKYGGMREQVLGIEAVLADGTIINSNRALRKNNTGFDLRQLFIATEGTFGIITKATVKLCPPPRDLELCLLATESFELIPKILGLCTQSAEIPTAFEFFDRASFDRVRSQNAQLQNPFESEYPYYVLLEFEKSGSESGLEKILEKSFEEGLVVDGVLAGSSKQFMELWAFRENISEALSSYKYLYKNDIAVPIAELSPVVSSIEDHSSDYADRMKLFLFGHIGDGNIHLNYGSDSYEDYSSFIKDKDAVEQQIFAVIRQHHGTISAEHGIGMLKKSQLDVVLSAGELALLKSLKNTLDPKGILNPGKVLPG